MMPANSRQQSYPAFLDLHDRKVLVIGEGNTAVRKVRRLLRDSPQLRIIAPSRSRELKALCNEFNLPHDVRKWTKADLADCSLVFAACDCPEQNQLIAQAADNANCFVNVANQPQISSFLVPSLIDRSPLLIAISSSGTSPILARLLTARIEAFVPQTYKELAALAKRHNLRIKQRITDWRLRRRFWEQLLSGRVGELILQGRLENVDDELERTLHSYEQEKTSGEVYLVGAGPGDPDLLSFRALRLMQQCDVVLFDRLVSDQIMELVNKAAERIYVGKRRHDHALPQESINQQLARLAKDGHRVLRLKGGDPFIFGRGGEEIETLAAEGVAFQVVPGITAAGGCASYAGIPLTHRDYAQACTFVTGHLKDGSVNLDWQALARPRQTVVIYMGLVGMPVICEQLIKHGLPANHPAALVAQGTRADQQVICATLGTLADKVVDSDIKPPTLIIIGEVVTLRDKLAWYETRQ